MDHDTFKKVLQEKGRELYRDMPWRRDTRPYYILVSEVMLQQTQVARVKPKFQAFVQRFPDFTSLAGAPLSDVLQMWVGLGYNRRARQLQLASRQIIEGFGGSMPQTKAGLEALAGIGPATAGAIMVYAFNLPQAFIETNARTVYFHSYFSPDQKVTDSELLPLIEATLDRDNPRNFYWALMDYGAWLKKSFKNSTNTMSAHYKKQSTFKGSVSEVRGRIIQLLSVQDSTREELNQRLGEDVRFLPALEGLIRDGLVGISGNVIHLTK